MRPTQRRCVILTWLTCTAGMGTALAQSPAVFTRQEPAGSPVRSWRSAAFGLDTDLLEQGKSNPAEEQAYQRGKKALDDRKFDQALEAFRDVGEMDGALADAASYWEAYTLNKMGQKGEALEVIGDLRRGSPKSRWVNEAQALEVEIRAATGQTPSPEAQGDEELKLMALNALMNSNPDRAVPMLGQFLQSNNSSKLKERALFVLAQSNSTEAREIMARVARGQSNPDLQAKALQYLGIHGGTANRQLLAEIYGSSSDVGVKRRILQSFMVSGERARLFELAKGEPSAELRAEAVRQLGVMGAHDELSQLYKTEAAVEIKRQIIQAMFVGGSVERLIELANKEKDPDLRRRAIRSLGLIGSRKTGDALLTIYATDQDASIRREVVQSLFLQNNARALVDLARKESNPEMKKAIVQKLSIMNSKEALDYLMEILNK